MVTFYLADVFGPVLQGVFYLGHELACVSAVDDAVIEAERQANDATDGDRIGAVFIGDDEGLFEEAADAEDGGLRLGDHGRAELFAEDS